MYIIQFKDLDEGSAARWRDISSSKHESRDAVRNHLKRLRATDDEECLYLYRIVEVGSPLYYSQPTDALEY